MSPIYIGVRIEISNRTQKIKSLPSLYNNTNGHAQIYDVCENGRVYVEKSKDMIMARGKKEDRVNTGLTNFAIMIPSAENVVEVERIVKIINVLGNDRLIREKVKTFVTGQSALNKIPELQDLILALNNINKIIKGFTEVAWYYAPEVKFDE